MAEISHEELLENKSSYYEIFKASANSLNIDKIARSLEEDAEDETHF